MSNSVRPHRRQPTRLLVHGIFQTRVLGWGATAFCGDAGDYSGSSPGLGRSPGGGNGNPLQYSCQGNPMARRAWRATQSIGSQSQTPLSKHAQACYWDMNRGFAIKIFNLDLVFWSLFQKTSKFCNIWLR